jgi:hypothetical protein
VNSFAFSVSMPPSVNNMFATVTIKGKVRRITSRDYKAWRETETGKLTQAWELAGSPKFERHLSLTIHLGLNYGGDISNRIKGIEDLLGQAIPGFPDDRYIDQITIQRVPGIEGARVIIMQGSAPIAQVAA